jgi:hypothetical protein
MILPQYQQPHEADDDGDDGGSSLIPIPSGCIIRAVAHKPVAYPPLPQYQQPTVSSPPSHLHPQHAKNAATAHYPWQQQHQHLIMTAAPPLGVPPGYALTQTPSAAHYHHPVMMPPTVFPQGYVQLQPFVHQQQQLIMAPVNSIPLGFVPEQQQQPTYPPILFNRILHHPGGWVPVDNVGQPQPQQIPHQAYMNPLPYQHMGVYHPFPVQEDDAAFDAADAASAPTSPAAHARASRHQQMQQQQQQRAIQSPYSLAAQSPNSHHKSSPPNPSPMQRRSPESSNFEGNPNRTKNTISTLVHRPIHSPQKKTSGRVPDRES